MSLSFNSISEYAISELPFSRPVADLEIELFSDQSVARGYQESADLALGYANDEVSAVYYGGSKDTWVVTLDTTVNDSVQQIFNFIDTAEFTLAANTVTSTILNSEESTNLDFNISESTAISYKIPTDTIELVTAWSSNETFVYSISDPAELSLDGEYQQYRISYSIETGSLSIDAVERRIPEDAPSVIWRDRPGLPIGPISVNSISVEQFEGSIGKSYPIIDQVSLEISSDLFASTRLNIDSSGAIILADASTESQSYNFVDQGNLTTVSIRDVVVFLNSEETARLDISASDQIQQVFEFFEIAEINWETATQTSILSSVDDTTGLTFDFTSQISVAMDYQETAETIIDGGSLESKVSNYSDNALLIAEPNDSISIRYNSFDTGITSISAKTFAKEYTFLQQETFNDYYELTLSAESSESFRVGGGTTVVRGRQFWIG